nr:hypothetical protein [[Ochrobactrum] soli]
MGRRSGNPQRRLARPRWRRARPIRPGPGDADDQLEAAMSRRLDKLGRQIDTLDLDLAVLGETVAQFIHFWMTITPPLTGAAQSAARAKGAERFEGFLQTLGRRLATGDRFLKELSRDVDISQPSADVDR